jgi:hypothetical protein
LCEEVPRQKAAESRKIPESGSVIPREGVERLLWDEKSTMKTFVIPREGVERIFLYVSQNCWRSIPVIPREGVERIFLYVSQNCWRSIPVIPREGVESISLCHPPQRHRNSSERELSRREMDGISQPKTKETVQASLRSSCPSP